MIATKEPVHHKSKTQHVKHLIVYSEYPHRGSSWLDEYDKNIFLDRWDDVIKLL